MSLFFIVNKEFMLQVTLHSGLLDCIFRDSLRRAFDITKPASQLSPGPASPAPPRPSPVHCPDGQTAHPEVSRGGFTTTTLTVLVPKG